MEGVSGGCSESDPVPSRRLRQLQEPGVRAYQDFPGAQRAAAKKGTQRADMLRGMKACKRNVQPQTYTAFNLILLSFNVHFRVSEYRAAYAGPGRAAGHGEGPDQVQKEVPGDGADGPGRERESRYGGKVCLQTEHC